MKSQDNFQEKHRRILAEDSLEHKKLFSKVEHTILIKHSEQFLRPNSASVASKSDYLHTNLAQITPKSIQTIRNTIEFPSKIRRKYFN
jgi:hypothetical protein